MIESERMENDIPHKWNPKANRSSYSYIRQSRLPKLEELKKDHFILVKGTVQQEDVAVLIIYVLTVGILIFIKQTLLDMRGLMGPNAIIVGNFNNHSH